MKQRNVVIFLILVLAGALVPLRGGQEISFGEVVSVARDETQKGIVSFGGRVTVEGRVRESIILFGGSLVLSGEVGDSVVGFGAYITLKPTAVIKGDIASIGGTLVKEPGCVIEGDTVYFKGGEALSKLFSGGLFSFPLIPIILIFKLIGFFVWLLIALVMAGLFPRQIVLASSHIRTAFWPVVGIGFAAILLFGGLVVVFALLSLILIGIPFLLLLGALGLAVKIFGQVALFHFFGESLGRSFSNRSPSPMAAVLIGLVVVSFVTFVPILGFFVSFCLSIIGWGVTIRTRFGTRENWLKRQAPPAKAP
jgi:cytoskeletal protein CcmA (bactofilin family)